MHKFIKFLLLGLLIFTCTTIDVTAGNIYNRRDVDEVVATAQDLDTAATFSIDVGIWDKVACQFTWASADATDATIKLQGSVDATNFEDYSGSLYTLATAAGSHVYDVEVDALETVKLIYAKGSNTAGTYEITCRKEVPNGGEQ